MPMQPEIAMVLCPRGRILPASASVARVSPEREREREREREIVCMCMYVWLCVTIRDTQAHIHTHIHRHGHQRRQPSGVRRRTPSPPPPLSSARSLSRTCCILDHETGEFLVHLVVEEVLLVFPFGGGLYIRTYVRT